MAKEDAQIRLAAIAGATSALNYMEKNRHATRNEAIRHVADSMEEILESISQ
jgi:hypothetical protein